GESPIRPCGLYPLASSSLTPRHGRSPVRNPGGSMPTKRLLTLAAISMLSFSCAQAGGGGPDTGSGGDSGSGSGGSTGSGSGGSSSSGSGGSTGSGGSSASGRTTGSGGPTSPGGTTGPGRKGRTTGPG